MTHCTYPAEVRLRLVLSQEFLRTRLEEDEGGRGEERRSLRASDEGEWRLSKSAISLQNGPTDTDCGRTDVDDTRGLLSGAASQLP